jgi:hypothetical protein
MKPLRHKKRLISRIMRLRNEVCRLMEDGHLQYPYKSQEEVEHDINNLCYEIERTELAK